MDSHEMQGVRWVTFSLLWSEAQCVVMLKEPGVVLVFVLDASLY